MTGIAASSNGSELCVKCKTVLYNHYHYDRCNQAGTRYATTEYAVVEYKTLRWYILVFRSIASIKTIVIHTIK